MKIVFHISPIPSILWIVYSISRMRFECTSTQLLLTEKWAIHPKRSRYRFRPSFWIQFSGSSLCTWYWPVQLPAWKAFEIQLNILEWWIVGCQIAAWVYGNEKSSKMFSNQNLPIHLRPAVGLCLYANISIFISNIKISLWGSNCDYYIYEFGNCFDWPVGSVSALSVVNEYLKDVLLKLEIYIWSKYRHSRIYNWKKIL